jgi:predicted nucleic acid-binding protein
MNPLVIDSTIALGLCFEDHIDAVVLQTLEELRLRDALVPAHWHLETGEALLVAERRRKLNSADGKRFLELLGALRIETDLETSSKAWQRTLVLAHDCAITLYEAAYLELAERRKAGLATRSKNLARAARKIGISELLA